MFCVVRGEGMNIFSIVLNFISIVMLFVIGFLNFKCENISKFSYFVVWSSLLFDLLCMFVKSFV